MVAGIRKSQEGYSLTGVREDRSPAAVGTPQPTPVISNRVTPNFYKENDEGTAVQNAPETLEIDDDSEDEGAEIRTPTIAPQYIPPPQISSIVDEDYDT
ncbi:hypothetical protein C0J52_15635 [Blattella germanica]|nr:hypothetical protein C0J52_15635 [Blattella germanica]